MQNNQKRKQEKNNETAWFKGQDKRSTRFCTVKKYKKKTNTMTIDDHVLSPEKKIIENENNKRWELREKQL